ncbi:MAG: hypothetical protein ACHREM_32685 [Polyangiales bacterium]
MTALLDLVKEMLGLAAAPNPEAEMQVLLKTQRAISDEIARRELK